MELIVWTPDPRPIEFVVTFTETEVIDILYKAAIDNGMELPAMGTTPLERVKLVGLIYPNDDPTGLNQGLQQVKLILKEAT